MADEVQSGLGRTGKLWAIQNWGVVPDVMTSAKGLAGGVPIGATITRRDILDSLKKGEQTSTFGGNPLSCAAGSATLDYILRNDLPGQAVKKGELFLGLLRSLASKHRIAREARGMGMMLALEMRVDIQNILMNSIKEHVLFTYSGRTIVRLLPPLIMSEDQIRSVAESLDRVLALEAKATG